MAQEDYDIVLDAKKRVNGTYDKYYEQVEAASEAGSLRLVDEFVFDPTAAVDSTS